MDAVLPLPVVLSSFERSRAKQAILMFLTHSPVLQTGGFDLALWIGRDVIPKGSGSSRIVMPLFRRC